MNKKNTYYGETHKKCGTNEKYIKTDKCCFCMLNYNKSLSIGNSRKIAKENNLLVYYGKPHKKCGATLKYTCGSACVKCASTYAKNWRNTVSGHEKYLNSIKKYQKSENGMAHTKHAKALRRVREINPKLNNKEKQAILEIYKKAKNLTKQTGIEYHVDYIKPLAKGGLHHPKNLQILTKSENLRKWANI